MPVKTIYFFVLFIIFEATNLSSLFSFSCQEWDNELVLSAPILLTLNKENKFRNSLWRASIKHSRNCRAQRQSWNDTKSHNLSRECSFLQVCHGLFFTFNFKHSDPPPAFQQLLIKEAKITKSPIQKWIYE